MKRRRRQQLRKSERCHSLMRRGVSTGRVSGDAALTSFAASPFNTSKRRARASSAPPRLAPYLRCESRRRTRRPIANATSTCAESKPTNRPPRRVDTSLHVHPASPVESPLLSSRVPSRRLRRRPASVYAAVVHQRSPSAPPAVRPKPTMPHPARDPPFCEA